MSGDTLDAASAPSAALKLAAAEALLRLVPRLLRLTKRGLLGSLPNDLSPAQLLILGRLTHGETTVGSLARAAFAAPPTASELIAGLEVRGFVARRRREYDRREVAVALTAAGRAAYDRASAVALERLSDAVGRLTPEEQRRLIAVLVGLDVLLERMEQIPAPLGPSRSRGH